MKPTTVLATTTQQKWSYDADSFATLTVADASHTTIATGESGDLILDAADDVILDSHAGKWRFKRNGTLTNMVSALASDGSKMIFDNQVSDAGYDFKCSDGGVGITAFSIDAANAGAATFNSTVAATGFNATTTTTSGCLIDQNYSVTTASSTVGLDIDFDKTGTSTSNNTMIGVRVDMDNTTATNGTNTMTGLQVTPTLTHAATAGTTLIKGAEIVATGSTPGDTTTRALDITATGADYNQGMYMNVADGGVDIKLVSSADTGDFCTIATTAHGATTITTVDNSAAAAHLTLAPDGDVIIGGATPKLVIGDAGAEDTMLVFDGNAVDYRMGLDDSEDLLEIGVGTTHGTTAALLVTPNADVELIGTLGVNALIADESSSGIHTMFTAGEALVRGEVVYFKAGDSKMWKAVATASATSRCVAMAADDISADAVGKFLLQGFVRDNGSFPAYTVGATLFTPEAETASQNVPEEAAPDTDGDFVQVLGWAVTADMVYFNPSNDIIEVA